MGSSQNAGVGSANAVFALGPAEGAALRYRVLKTAPLFTIPTFTWGRSLEDTSRSEGWQDGRKPSFPQKLPYFSQS